MQVHDVNYLKTAVYIDNSKGPDDYLQNVELYHLSIYYKIITLFLKGVIALPLNDEFEVLFDQFLSIIFKHIYKSHIAKTT